MPTDLHWSAGDRTQVRVDTTHLGAFSSTTPPFLPFLFLNGFALDFRESFPSEIAAAVGLEAELTVPGVCLGWLCSWQLCPWCLWDLGRLGDLSVSIAPSSSLPRIQCSSVLLRHVVLGHLPSGLPRPCF